MSINNSTNDNQKAADFFLERVRTASAENGIVIKHRYTSTESQLRPARDIAKTISIIDEFNNDNGRETITCLLAGFEELCRKNKIEYPEDLRELISSTLVKELLTNAQTFSKHNHNLEKTLRQCVSLTIYQGTDFCSALDEEEFECLRFPFGIDDREGRGHELLYPFRQAALYRPANPRKFLKNAVDIFHKIMSDDRYALLRDKPNYVVEAAIYHFNNLEKHLEKIISEKTLITPKKLSLGEIAGNSGLPYLPHLLNEEDELLIEIMDHASEIDIDDYPCDYN